METSIPVTRTRILVPRLRSDYLSRPRLLELLSRLLEKKVVLVSAPAGYGKTTLLADFTRKTTLPVAWYAIDPLDQDPQRFITYFIAAINQRFPSFGAASLEALQNSSGKLDLNFLAATLVNDAYDHITEHFILVLDDYHLVDRSELVNHFVSRFAQDADENVHLVFASRTLLSLPDLPLMVARSQVGGLSFEELTFSNPEIQELYNQNFHLDLDEQQVEELVQKTEGWITGLLLTSRTGDRDVPSAQAVRASGVGLNEYFQQLVMQNAQEVQDFLLRTSLLEEFDPKLCRDVIGKALELVDINWESLISTVLRSNLFVLRVGEEGDWLRYHHLFRDYLQSAIMRERPAEVHSIWPRLAEHYQGDGEWEQAYRIYRRLGQTSDLVRLIERAGPFLTVGGRIGTLSEWLDELPMELISRHPALVSLQGSVAVMQGDMRQGLHLFDQAIKAMQLPEDRDNLVRTLVRRAASYNMEGNYQAAAEDARRTLELVDDDLSLRSLQGDAMRAIGISLYQQGDTRNGLDWLLQAVETYKSIKDNKNEAVASMEVGLLHQTLGNYTAAEESYNQSLVFWRSTHNSMGQANLLNNLGVLQHLTGDYESAASTLDKALQHARLSTYSRLEAFALAGIGDIYRDLEAAEEAAQAYRQAGDLARKTENRFLALYVQIVQAGLLGEQAKADEAAAGLDGAEQKALEMEAPFEAALCSLERGALLVHNGDCRGGRSELMKALPVFELGGHQVQMGRTHLLLGVASFSMGEIDQAQAHLDAALAGHNLAPMTPTARFFREQFSAMSKNALLKTPGRKVMQRIHAFEERLPGLRKRLRQRGPSVPFAPPRLSIRGLGRMQVRINGRVITSSAWQTQYARDLFFILVAHPEGLTREAIGDIFWPDADPEDVRFRFKNTIYRVRRATGRDTLLLQDDYYRFNRNMDYEYDVENFLKEVKAAQNAGLSGQQEDQYQAAVRNYRGTFLPEIGETWVVPERHRLQQIYFDCMFHLSELYLQDGDHHRALETCNSVLAVDATQEEAHRMAMRIYAAQGNRAALARQYDRCVQVLDDELAVPPSPQTRTLYTQLMA